MTKLDLGCGLHKRPGFIGIDKKPFSGVDMVMDLETALPIESNSVDYIYSRHCFEHVVFLDNLIDELYRICKNKAIIEIIVPHFCTSYRYYDHIRGFQFRSLIRYEVGHFDKEIDYFRCIFRGFIGSPFSGLFSKFYRLYEKTFISYFVRCGSVKIIFEVVKPLKENR